MDVWGSIVLCVEILLLIAGWLLFQQAKSDLTARAAQLPVLSDIRALQKSVAALIEQLKLEAGQTSAQLEARCLEARDLLQALDRRLESQHESPNRSKRRTVKPAATVEEASEPSEASEEPESARIDAAETDGRRSEAFEMADAGSSAAEIARETGLSEGEVELMLSLRPRVN
jgi:hypothetical protein